MASICNPSDSDFNRSSRYYCGHCEQKLSKTLFFQHKKMYFDKATNTWRKERIITVGDDEDFNMFPSELELGAGGKKNYALSNS